MRLGRRKSKYRAKRTQVDEYTFASRKEAKRYKDLKFEQSMGEIECLELQPKFPLRVNGELICTYVGDFIYLRKGDTVKCVEDVKGYKTRVYIIKSKLFKALYPQYKFIES